MVEPQELRFLSTTPLIQEIETFREKLNDLIKELDLLNKNELVNNTENQLEYLTKIRDKTAIELFKNFILVTFESLSKQLNNVNSFKSYYESFLSQSSKFNQSIENETARISGLNSEALKRRATESIKNEIDNFYSIYNISMKI